MRWKVKVLGLKDDGPSDLNHAGTQPVSSNPGQQNASRDASGQLGVVSWHQLSTNCVYTVKHIRRISKYIDQMALCLLGASFLNLLSLTFPICEMGIRLHIKSSESTELVLKKTFEASKLNFIATGV